MDYRKRFKEHQENAQLSIKHIKNNNLRFLPKLQNKTENYIFTGTTDFVVSKGLFQSQKPYFFIQEFKKGKLNTDPEPQLLTVQTLRI
ncbi:MAG: hypothetical protein U9P38_07400 [Campylobacterota bacterium]|nr:hypothetical protein [Campylobacterota bacterium]